MRLLLLPLVLIVGCKGSEMDFPVGGGGAGGGGGTIRIDAAVMDGSGSGSEIAATACVLTDPRDLTTCQTSGSMGLTVALGSASAITADDGTFTIVARPGAALWSVTGVTVVQSVTPLSGQTRIPVMDSTVFSELENANGVLAVPQNGAVMVRIARAGVPVQGEVVQVSTATDPRGTLYDPANEGDAWNTDATGPLGTAYVPSATSGTATLTVSASGTTQGTLGGVPITDGGVTFLFVDVL